MLSFATYFMERYGGAKPVILYHGTHGKNLPSILSQGLIPDPKKRAWAADNDANFNTPSRVSIGGIYLTDNLMTAISSAGNAGNKGTRAPVIVMVQIQPRSTLQDEDNVTFTASRVPMPGITPDHEYSLMRLYKAYVQGDDPEFVRSSQEAYVSQGLSGLVTNKYQPQYQHPELTTRVTALLQKGWLIALERKVAHLGDYFWREDPGVPRPQVAQAEATYLRYMDQMTRALKSSNRREVQDRKPFMNNMRLMERIGFKGANRVLAIFEIQKIPGEKYKEGVLLRYPASLGEIPAAAFQDFQEQWKERVGTLTWLGGEDRASSPGPSQSTSGTDQ